jgi:hypothetical protein
MSAAMTVARMAGPVPAGLQMDWTKQGIQLSVLP